MLTSPSVSISLPCGGLTGGEPIHIFVGRRESMGGRASKMMWKGDGSVCVVQSDDGWHKTRAHCSMITCFWTRLSCWGLMVPVRHPATVHTFQPRFSQLAIHAIFTLIQRTITPTRTLNMSLLMAAILGPSLLRPACLLDITGRVLVGLDGKEAKLGAVWVTAVVEVLQQQPRLTGVYLANILADLQRRQGQRCCLGTIAAVTVTHMHVTNTHTCTAHARQTSCMKYYTKEWGTCDTALPPV